MKNDKMSDDKKCCFNCANYIPNESPCLDGYSVWDITSELNCSSWKGKMKETKKAAINRKTSRRVMTQRAWKEKNNFWNTHACCFCRFYHDEDVELIEGDRDYCLEHGKNEHAETEMAFCRVMRDDGVKDYYLKNNEPSVEGCKRWLTDGYV